MLRAAAFLAHPTPPPMNFQPPRNWFKLPQNWHQRRVHQAPHPAYPPPIPKIRSSQTLIKHWFNLKIQIRIHQAHPALTPTPLLMNRKRLSSISIAILVMENSTLMKMHLSQPRSLMFKRVIEVLKFIKVKSIKHQRSKNQRSKKKMVKKKKVKKKRVEKRKEERRLLSMHQSQRKFKDQEVPK